MRVRTPAIAAGLFAMAMLMASGCSKPPQQQAPPPPAVTVTHPVMHEVMEWDEYPGYLEAKEIADVRARVDGYIEKADFDEGSLVKAGQVLFIIDPRSFQATLLQRQAELKGAQAQQAYAQNEFKRLSDIGPNGGASELEIEDARQRMLQAEATIAGADAQIVAAKLDVEFTTVTAPIDGRISKKLVTKGNVISGGDALGTLLTTITSIDPIYAYMNVDEKSALKYQKLARDKAYVNKDGKVPVYLGLANEEGAHHEGFLDFTDNRINRDTGTLNSRAAFPNPDGLLTPGMFAKLRVPGSSKYTALLVPDLAVGLDQNQNFVLVLNSDDTVERRTVSPGARFGKFRAIPDGLTVEDRIIIEGLQKARPGGKVAPELKEIQQDQMQLNDNVTTKPAATTQPMKPREVTMASEGTR